MRERRGELEIARPDVLGVEDRGGGAGYREVAIVTRRGDVLVRHYPAGHPPDAVIMVGGVGGGFDTPAGELYPQLAGDLADDRVAALRVRFRNPSDIGEGVHDVLAGIAYLRGAGAERFALVGHSLGGAVVINAAAEEPAVRAVVALSTQSYGTDRVRELRDRPLLLLHGGEDPVLPVACSAYVFRLAGERAQMEILPGAGHVLNEVAEEVRTRVRNWLRDEFIRGREG